MSKIRFSSDILKRLGEELNPGIDKSILELVKNSYDADADNCTIDLHKNESTGTYTLCITDDGDGMTPEEINNGWLVLGHSQKTKEKTPKGRIPAGSKGLGRLAALRMGTSVELSTVSKNTPQFSSNLLINWEDYDKESIVDNVELEIIEKENSSGKKGTSVIINGITQHIYWGEIKKLAKELILLSDPFGDTPSAFNPILISEEFTEFNNLVKKRYFNEATYHVVASLASKNQYSIFVKDWKGNNIFETTTDLPEANYNTVNLKFELWIFVLNSTAFVSREVTITDIRIWLKEFGGISFYQNGIKVAPYGDEGNDWLELNLQRAKSPEERPSTNTVIGRVVVEDNEELLHQKTDRSGFIENEAFFELKKFCTDVLNWVANRRLELAEQRRAQARIETPIESDVQKEKVIELFKAEKFDREETKKAFQAYETAKQKEIETLKKDILLYRTLSTAGIEAATFAHEMQTEHIKNIYLYKATINNIVTQHVETPYKERILKQIEHLELALSALDVSSTATLSIIKHEKRKIEKIDVQKIINSVVTNFDDFYKTKNTKVLVNKIEDNLNIFGTISSIECIIINLITNALTALEKKENERKIVEINFEIIDSNTFSLIVSDNGNGLEDIDEKDIWLPGRTTKINGTGLGLTIVRDTVKDLGGTCSVVSTGKLGGADFITILPRI